MFEMRSMDGDSMARLGHYKTVINRMGYSSYHLCRKAGEGRGTTSLPKTDPPPYDPVAAVRLRLDLWYPALGYGIWMYRGMLITHTGRRLTRQNIVPITRNKYFAYLDKGKSPQALQLLHYRECIHFNT